ncbi:unnamed protein product, partial [Effrenium voratum]
TGRLLCCGRALQIGRNGTTLVLAPATAKSQKWKVEGGLIQSAGKCLELSEGGEVLAQKMHG